jgi:hypothetical protein
MASSSHTPVLGTPRCALRIMHDVHVKLLRFNLKCQASEAVRTRSQRSDRSDRPTATFGIPFLASSIRIPNRRLKVSLSFSVDVLVITFAPSKEMAYKEGIACSSSCDL